MGAGVMSIIDHNMALKLTLIQKTKTHPDFYEGVPVYSPGGTWAADSDGDLLKEFAYAIINMTCSGACYRFYAKVRDGKV
jgi:hypothetical protein